MKTPLPMELQTFVPDGIDAVLNRGYLHVSTVFNGHRAEDYVPLKGQTLDEITLRQACNGLRDFVLNTEPPS